MPLNKYALLSSQQALANLATRSHVIRSMPSMHRTPLVYRFLVKEHLVIGQSHFARVFEKKIDRTRSRLIYRQFW